MAAKDLLAKLKNLSQEISSGEAGKKARKEINEHEAICTFSSQELTNSLMAAFEHYNPIQAKDDRIKNEKRKIFKQFSLEVLKGFRDEVRTNPKFELEKSSRSNITFLIAAKAGDSQKLFTEANKNICEDLLKDPLYAEHFSLGQQEQITAKGKRATAHTSKSGRGSLMDFEAAHGAGFSAFEADSALRANAITSMLDITNLPSEAVKATKKLKSNFLKEKIEGESNFVINKSGKIESKSTITMSIQTARQNVVEGGPASAASKRQNKLLKATAEDIKELIANSPDDWDGDSKKSPSVKEGVAFAIINTPVKKRLAKKGRLKNKSQYKKVIKPTSTPKQESVSERETKRTHIKGGGVTNSMKVAALKKPKGAEAGNGGVSQQKDFATKIRQLLKVKRAINQRLPAEIRRNMGKPALTNRSGRFANSAEVTEILPAAQTLMVKYTYRLNPYETFENTGKKKWPSGYNPKPLIAKSIRGLALGLIDEKLTIRRA